MKTVKFVYWQDKEFWLGYLHDYPDFMTQGETLEELHYVFNICILVV